MSDNFSKTSRSQAQIPLDSLVFNFLSVQFCLVHLVAFFLDQFYSDIHFKFFGVFPQKGDQICPVALFFERF
jgi:hypothetical protein